MRHSPTALMLFAAGLGTRMAPLTADCPKPLIPVAGRALIDHALAQAPGMDRIVVNLHYLPDQIEHHFHMRSDILFSAETDTILETGGGLKRALPLLAQNPVFTMNTDAVWTGPTAADTLRAHWDPARMDALLLLVPREQARGHRGDGDFLMGDGGQLQRGPGLVYTGAQILCTDGLADFSDQVFSLNLLWNRIAERGRLFGCVHPGGWCDVGRPESIAIAEAMLAEVGDD